MTDRDTAYRRCWDFNQAHPVGSPVLAWPGARASEPLQTRTRTSAWPLPSGEPVVSVVGYPGGIFLDHIEPDPTRQPAVPDVEFEMPACPICGDALGSDGDALVCDGCGVSWDGSGQRGDWHAPDAARCPARCQPLRQIHSDLIEQCVLAEGHDPDEEWATHRTPDGLTSWDDRDDRSVVDSEGETA